ncbi:hypothetical protein [Rheinheimera hassiensis]|uniref:hypothetical protein n=1 Tax=Rheinheimera hassiensis TaxID=1193627 RepID=UPI001F06F2C4|nr:hypothetical protein [Rheinheimera hassiensis]
MQEEKILSGLREVGIKLVESGKTVKGNSAYAAVAADYLIEKLAITGKPYVTATELVKVLGERLVMAGKLKSVKSNPEDVMKFLYDTFGIDMSRPLVTAIARPKTLH